MRAITVIVDDKSIGDFCRSTGDDCFIASIKGVPADAEMAGVWYNPERREFCIRFKHESFDDISAGCILPWREVTITRHLG